MISSLIACVDNWSREAPDRIAHESAGRCLTYAELGQRSDALAAFLERLDLPGGQPVAVLGHKEPEMLVSFLACVKAGHPYIPIDRSTPAQRIEHVLEGAGRPYVLRADDLPEPPPAAPRERTPEADHPYYILFTSGSTGAPKGVVITHGCLSTFVGWITAEHAWSEGAERVLNQAPFSFDLSVMDMSIALATGSTLVSITSDQVANPRDLYAALAASDLTAWVSTPSFAQMCLTEGTFGAAMLPRLRRFLFCGETLPPDVAAELLRRFPGAEVWNTYGPTETTVAVTSVQITAEVLARYPVLPVGRPMPGVDVRLCDERGEPVADGERGEIVIAGPNVSPGYLGRPDLTARAFTSHGGQRAYRTGDWGRFRDGQLFFEGRRDGQIKLHGYRIEIGDIEENLRALDDVRDAVVLPVERAGRIESLAAFVVPGSGRVESESHAGRALRGALSNRLPAYMVPRSVRFLDAFPMTANGKADRRKLRELLA